MTVAAGAAALIGGVIVAGRAFAGDDDRGGDRAGMYKQTNLVSSIKGLAPTTDPNLKNPWGIASAPGGALWVSDNATRLSTLYNGDGTIVPLVVKIPDAPTGIVWNPRPDQFQFVDPNQNDPNKKMVSAAFIFAGEEGKISAWSGALVDRTMAVVVVKPEKHEKVVYKGLAFGTNKSGNFIFATNFFGGEVEVYDSTFKETKLKGSFHDPRLPKGYAPFGIANINGQLFVSFAKQSDKDKGEEVTGRGLGIVDVFDTQGELIKRFATDGPLDAPWGMVRAPFDFGRFSNAFLVGNFGNGKINAFDDNGKFLGDLRREDGKPIVIEGLWSLGFGTFAKADPEDLYFTAGIKDEKEGLFGEIAAVSRHGGRE
jgi:uncharacterized protein (TIGR03118 family)